MAVDEKEKASAAADAAIGELVVRLSDDTARLVRDEIRLARAEMTTKAKAAGVGTGLFGGAVAFAFYGCAVLVAAAVIGLSTVVAPWAAALMVAAVLFVLACTVALMGKREFERAGPPLPTEAVQSTMEDVDELKRGLHA
jgi:Flp pilus assembly protein TadB